MSLSPGERLGGSVPPRRGLGAEGRSLVPGRAAAHLAPVEPGGQERAVDECRGRLGGHAQVQAADLHVAALQIHEGLLHVSVYRQVAGHRENRRDRTIVISGDTMAYVENPK